MCIRDSLHTDNPTWGARQMSAQLKTRGYQVGRRKARRYMNAVSYTHLDVYKRQALCESILFTKLWLPDMD